MRKSVILILAGVGSAAIILLASAKLLRGAEKAPAEGALAPDFTLNSQEKKAVSLQEFRGKWVVLYFYPKDFTGGCTIEAHNFQRDLGEYEKRNAVIVGVSTQDEKTHEAFCTKEGLNFRLLADRKGEVSRKYGSVVNLAVTKLSSRHTFLIDPQGVIRKAWMSVNFNVHSLQVLAALGELQKSRSWGHSMYIHMFAFRMKPGVTAEQKKQMLCEIRALTTEIPEILESWAGMNESARAASYELGGAMKFADRQSFERYGPHPAHQKLVSWLMPLIEPVEIDFPC